MVYENFVFLGSFRNAYESIPDDYQKLLFLEAIMKYGTNGELPNPEEEPLIYAMLQLVIPNIDNQKEKYTKASKGGRPKTFNQKDFDELFDKGLTNQDVADTLGASLSTVERRKKVWKENNSYVKPNDIGF